MNGSFLSKDKTERMSLTYRFTYTKLKMDYKLQSVDHSRWKYGWIRKRTDNSMINPGYKTWRYKTINFREISDVTVRYWEYETDMWLK